MSHFASSGCLIAALDPRPVLGLASVLANRGRAAVLLAAQPAEPTEPARMPAFRQFLWDSSSSATSRDSVTAACASMPRLSQLVIFTVPRAAIDAGAVIDAPPVDWRAITSAAMLQTMHLLQAASPLLRASGGSVVFVGASFALVGASAFVPLVTLQETQRGLMKSLARQWGGDGVSVNWVSLHACELWPELTAVSLPSRSEAIPVALGRRPNAAEDLAGTLEYFDSPAGRAVTGSTLCLDGGEWMLP